MALKIRLRKQGRRNRPFYRIVVTDSRNPRDGKYVESLGWYNPAGNGQEQELELKSERVAHWLNCGAQLSEKVVSLVKRSAPEVLKEQQEKKATKKKTNSKEEKKPTTKAAPKKAAPKKTGEITAKKAVKKTVKKAENEAE